MGKALAGAAVVALLAAGCGSAHGSTPPATNTTSARHTTALTVTRIGSLPQAMSKASAVALPGGRLVVLGGYASGSSLDTILVGTPGLLRVVGHLPQPTHDAAAGLLGHDVYLLGGGQSASWPNVVRYDLSSGTAAEAPPLDEPLSDLGAVVIGGHAYLVGGYTGTQFATAILSYPESHVVARLPTGTRYAGVAAIGRTIYVAGGLTTAGPTKAVYAVSLSDHVRRVATLPAPQDHAAMAAIGNTLYYVGGRKVLAIDPSSGKVTVAARLPVSLSDPTATTLGTTSIVVTGGGTTGVWSLTLS